MSNMQGQLQNDFSSWSTTVQGQLSGDVAGNLSIAITELGGTGRTIETVKENVDNITANVNDISTHSADYVKHPGYAGSTGSLANTYVVSTTPAPTVLIDGMGIVANITVASTGASTLNWSGLGAIPILDSLGNPITSGGLKLNIPYSMRYSAVKSSFIVQGKGGGGNATASQLLNTMKATVDSGPIVGTMPNNTASSKIYTVSTVDQPVEAGYTDGALGSIKVKGESALLATNIVAPNVIGGITGTATIESLGGKKYASGTAITNSSFNIVVTGLTFVPSAIMWCETSPPSSAGFYNANDGSPNYIPYVSMTSNSMAWTSKNGTAPVTITPTGFTVNTDIGTGTNISWRAFE